MEVVVLENSVSDKISVLDKCIQEKIPFLLINKTLKKDENGKIKKQTSGRFNGWNEKSFDYLMENYNNKRLKQPKSYNTIMVNMKQSPYMAVDIDEEDKKKAKEMLKEYGDKWRTTSCSKICLIFGLKNTQMIKMEQK